MPAQSITYNQPTPTTYQRAEELRGGDEVLIYDGRSGCLEWHLVMDAFERDGRTKIRIAGANFYFDAKLIKDCRINHYIAPRGKLYKHQANEETLFLESVHGQVDSKMRRTIY